MTLKQTELVVFYLFFATRIFMTGSKNYKLASSAEQTIKSNKNIIKNKNANIIKPTLKTLLFIKKNVKEIFKRI